MKSIHPGICELLSQVLQYEKLCPFEKFLFPGYIRYGYQRRYNQYCQSQCSQCQDMLKVIDKYLNQ